MTKREIKFRACDERKKVIIPWEKLSLEIDGYASTLDKIEGFTLDQYTGLKDANGVEVYENDLLETDWIIDSEGYFITELGQVVWRGNGWKVLVDGNKYDLISAWEENGFAVIGNVHQNPELLGE